MNSHAVKQFVYGNILICILSRFYWFDNIVFSSLYTSENFIEEVRCTLTYCFCFLFSAVFL